VWVAVAVLEGVSVRPRAAPAGVCGRAGGRLANLNVYGISASGLGDNKDVRLNALARADCAISHNGFGVASLRAEFTVLTI